MNFFAPELRRFYGINSFYYLILIIVLSSILISCESKINNLDSSPVIQNKEIISEIKNEYDLTNSLSKIDLDKRYKIDNVKSSNFFFETENLTEIDKINLDENGVPIKENGNYFPTSVAQLGLKAFNNYKKTGSEEAKQIFLNQAKWAKDNFSDRGNYGFWVFQDSIPEYHLYKPWTSAIAQGYLVSLCLSAFEITADKEYALIIEKALKGYLIPIKDGGFYRTWGNDEAWYEEYATERPSRVLNGAIFGLAGAYQVYRATGNRLALQIFNAGALTIRNHLSDYYSVYSSRYNLADWKNEGTKEHYHELHILQLLWLYDITGDSEFKKYAKLFLENDLDQYRSRQQYILPSKYASISASNCIDCENHGPQNLNNELWAHGGYWSSYKDSELIIDFGEVRKNIYGLTLYHINKISSEIEFDLYSFSDVNDKWQLKQKFYPKLIKDKVCAYNITGGSETYIEHFKIYEEINTSKIKLVFKTDLEHIIAFREINFLYDRSADIEHLLLEVQRDMIKSYGEKIN